MVDNVTVNPGSGGDTIAADDVSGVKYQIVKIAAGGADAAQYGASVFRHLAVGTTADDALIAGAGVVYGVTAVNTSETAVAYLHLYNLAGAPTLGTSTPHMSFPLPKGGGISFPMPLGIKFGVGIGFGIGSSPSGSGYVAANSVMINVLYVA